MNVYGLDAMSTEPKHLWNFKMHHTVLSFLLEVKENMVHTNTYMVHTNIHKIHANTYKVCKNTHKIHTNTHTRYIQTHTRYVQTYRHMQTHKCINQGHSISRQQLVQMSYRVACCCFPGYKGLCCIGQRSTMCVLLQESYGLQGIHRRCTA